MQHSLLYDWLRNLVPLGSGGVVNRVEEECYLITELLNEQGKAISADLLEVILENQGIYSSKKFNSINFH